MTQSELAGSDFTKSFISQIEKGHTRPSLKSLEIIAKRLNQPISSLLDEDESLPDSDKLDSLLANARLDFSEGRLNDAVVSFDKALQACPPFDHATRGEILFKKGHIRFAQRDFKTALVEFNSAVDELKQSHQTELYVRALCDVGSSHYMMGNYRSSREAFEEALAAYGTLGVINTHLLCTIESNLGNALAHLREYDVAVKILEDSLERSRNNAEYYLYGKICHILGYCYDALQQYPKAISRTQKALEFYSSVEDMELLLSAQLNLATHLRKVSEFNKAKVVASRALDTASKLRANDQKARAHIELAHIYLDQEDAKKALSHVTLAFDLAPAHMDVPKWTLTLLECSKRVPIPTETLASVEKACADWTGPPRDLAEIHSNLGELYSSQGNPEKANVHLSKSVALFRELRDT